MHEHEAEINETLVRHLLNEQFPQWAKLPIKQVQSDGTVNAIYRLGTEMCVRLPRISEVDHQIETEQIWLPKLAPTLPIAIPVPLGKGIPSSNYPYHWSVYSWLEGKNMAIEKDVDLSQAAIDLAGFLNALHKIDPSDGPTSYRGMPLAVQDSEVREAIRSLRRTIDTERATRLWEGSLQIPIWDRAPVWIHGDLLPANILVNHGRLSGIIDFGSLGIGDPACDLIPAWSILSSDTRDLFRSRLAIDDATWKRGRGWALSIALIILPYYQHTNPGLVAVANRMLNEIFSEN